MPSSSALPASLFGLIVGWVLGSQQARRHGAGRRAGGAGGAARPQPARRRRSPRRSIEARVQALQDASPSRIPRTRSRACSSATCTSTPSATRRRSPGTSRRSSSTRTTPNVSTDLGVAYYYTNQPDRALEQFEHSLAIDPKHVKTLLNMGIVRAFGKQDLDGAAQGVAAGRGDLAPDSPKGRRPSRASRACRARTGRHRGASSAVLLRAAPRSSSCSVVIAARVLATRRRRGAGRDRPAPRRRRGRRAAAAGAGEDGACPVCGTFVVPGKADQRSSAAASTDAISDSETVPRLSINRR